MKEIMKSFGIGFVALCAFAALLGLLVFYGVVQYVFGGLVLVAICWIIGEEIRHPSKTNYRGPG